MNRMIRGAVLTLAVIGIGVFLGLSWDPPAISLQSQQPNSMLLTFRPARELAATLAAGLPRYSSSNFGPKPADAESKDDSNVAPSPNAILNEVIITLKPGFGIPEVANRVGGRVLGSLTNINAHRLQFEDAAAAASARAQLQADPQVASLDWNYSVARPVAAETSGSAEVSALNLKASLGDSHGKIVVGLVDTAVQTTGTDLSPFLQPSVSISGAYTPDTDTLTHGTSMAETILQGLSAVATGGQASNVRILPVDVYGADQETTTYQVAQGVLKAVEGGATIINLSLGSDGDSAVLQQVIQQTHAQGVIFLSAAGNEPVTSATYPAAYPEVIAVTATDDNGNTAAYANRGSFVDIGVPGSVVVSYGGVDYSVVGTSAATALASGIAAGAVERQGLSAAKVEKLIRDSLALRQ